MESLLELREKGALTRALILIELLKNKKKLREISFDLKITPQGASNYIKMLDKDGLIDNDLNVTPEGIAFLQRFLANMTNFAERAYDEMGFISSCEAIALEKIKKNDRVFLIMNNGVLSATKKRKSKSSGIAETDGIPGDPIIVKNMEGIIDYKIGDLYILHVNYKDYSNEANSRRLRNFIKKNNITFVGTYGVIAKSLTDKLNIVAIPYAPVEACIEAAVKGVNSLLIYSPEMARFFFQKMAANINKYKVNPKFADL
jgi:putative transcriptional regulator